MKGKAFHLEHGGVQGKGGKRTPRVSSDSTNPFGLWSLLCSNNLEGSRLVRSQAILVKIWKSRWSDVSEPKTGEEAGAREQTGQGADDGPLLTCSWSLWKPQSS